MGTQHEVTKRQQLLNEVGCIDEPGWARQLVWQYNREAIKAPWFRIKEWDYYLITNEHYGVAFTIADLGYMGLVSASFLDFDNAKEHTKTVMDPLPRGKKYGLGVDSRNGYAKAKSEKVSMYFDTHSGKRKIQCQFYDFYNQKKLVANIELMQPPMDTMCIATPWEEKKTAFYYNQKINTMPAKGIVQFEGKEYEFLPETSAGTLDWGRGVWTYDNTWYWGTGNTIINGIPFGINLGYGFSDRSYASENVLFYNGKVHKLDEITIQFELNDKKERELLKPWKIISSDGRFEGGFYPILDRAAEMDYKLIASNQHQVFGKFFGTATLDDGKVLSIKDFLCAFEVVHNKY